MNERRNVQVVLEACLDILHECQPWIPWINKPLAAVFYWGVSFTGP